MKQLGRYEILEELGQGAMGIVYRARDPRIDRVVALKTITVQAATPAEAEDYRQRFFREAQAAGRLSHPGIVTIYDVGEEENTQTPYLVMEYIAGRSLDSLLTGDRLRVGEALDLAEQLAQALDYAHTQGVVHRDIKPANIILTPEGRAKITDFGVARMSLAHKTLPGQVVGTPSFMAPEQVSGEPADGRADLFSLGVILYWMLTGEKPFTGDTLTALSFKVVYKDPPPPSQLNPALRPDFDVVLARALAKSPSRRYQTGRQFAADLEDLRHGRSPRSLTQAIPPAPADRTVVHQAPAPPRALPDEPAPPAALLPERPRAFRLPVLLALALLAAGGAWWFVHQRTPPQPTSSHTPQALLETTPPPAGSGPAAPDLPAGPSPAPTETSDDRPEQQSSQDNTPSSHPSHQAAAPAPAPTLRLPTREPKPLPQPTATLTVYSAHNFRQAEVYIWVEDKLEYQGTLRGRRRRYGITSVYHGSFRTRLRLTPGWHNITVRVSSPAPTLFDQTRETQAEFAHDRARTLELYFGKAGFLAAGARSLTLNWKD